VLLLNDVERALSRLRQQSPDCVLLMGEAIGDRVVDDFQRALMLGRERFMVTVLVLGEKQTHLHPTVPSNNPLGRILSQPLRLRDLRAAITDGLDIRARYRNGR
jgi:hypothetical protein